MSLVEQTSGYLTNVIYTVNAVHVRKTDNLLAIWNHTMRYDVHFDKEYVIYFISGPPKNEIPYVYKGWKNKSLFCFLGMLDYYLSTKNFEQIFESDCPQEISQTEFGKSFEDGFQQSKFLEWVLGGNTSRRVVTSGSTQEFVIVESKGEKIIVEKRGNQELIWDKPFDLFCLGTSIRLMELHDYAPIYFVVASIYGKWFPDSEWEPPPPTMLPPAQKPKTRGEIAFENKIRTHAERFMRKVEAETCIRSFRDFIVEKKIGESPILRDILDQNGFSISVKGVTSPEMVEVIVSCEQ